MIQIYDMLNELLFHLELTEQYKNNRKCMSNEHFERKRRMDCDMPQYEDMDTGLNVQFMIWPLYWSEIVFKALRFIRKFCDRYLQYE